MDQLAENRRSDVSMTLTRMQTKLCISRENSQKTEAKDKLEIHSLVTENPGQAVCDRSPVDLRLCGLGSGT